MMIKSGKLSVKELTAAAMMTAVTALLAQVSFMTPWGVPLTLQTFAVALCGYALGSKLGTASISAYILMGAVGVPVFSSFRGGIGMLFGVTGGFLFGFIPFVFLCGLAVKQKNTALKLFIGALGLIVCHIFGIIQFSIVSASSLHRSFMLVSFPYILKDLASLTAAYFLSVAIRRAIPKTLH